MLKIQRFNRKINGYRTFSHFGPHICPHELPFTCWGPGSDPHICPHELPFTCWGPGSDLRAPRHQNCTPLLQQLHWLPISERIKYKTACMCYNAITGSTPSHLSELLHLYSPSRSLRSSSDTRMLKIQRFNRKTHGFRTFLHFGPHIWNNLPQDIRLLSLPSKSNSRHFSSQNISVKPHCPSLLSVCTVCVCVCACACVRACVRVHLLHNYAWTLVDIYIIIIFW